MKPPKGNQRRLNYPPLIAGLIFAIWGVYGIYTGHMPAGRGFPRHYSRAYDHRQFWSMVGISFAISAVFLIWGFIGKKRS